MKNYRYKKSFVFSNKAEDVASVLRSCVEFIEEPKDLIPVQPELLSRLKWAVTELLINGAKHANTHQSRLHVSIDEKSLIIEREDHGIPLRLTVDNGRKTLSWPITDFTPGQQFEVYQNGMDSLRIQIYSEDSASFLVVEKEDVEMPQLLINTSEHFGLMIIAKSSDALSYLYDRVDNKNIFRVTFNYMR